MLVGAVQAGRFHLQPRLLFVCRTSMATPAPALQIERLRMVWGLRTMQARGYMASASTGAWEAAVTTKQKLHSALQSTRLSRPSTPRSAAAAAGGVAPAQLAGHSGGGRYGAVDVWRAADEGGEQEGSGLIGSGENGLLLACIVTTLTLHPWLAKHSQQMSFVGFVAQCIMAILSRKAAPEDCWAGTESICCCLCCK